jgi:small subunit ribosomal protein S5
MDNTQPNKPNTPNAPTTPGASNQQPFQRGGGGYGGQRGGGFNRGGFGNRPGGPRGPRQDRYQGDSEFYEKVVQVNRVSKKSTGGDVRSLSVLVVVGDRKGKVGVGLGKAKDVQNAVRKASIRAKKFMIEVPLKDNRTIPHEIFVKLGAAKVLLKSAPEGTGVIAGGAVRVVVEAAGIKDVVSKTLGTSNKASNVYATLEALRKLKPMAVVEVKLESRVENLESSEKTKDQSSKSDSAAKKSSSKTKKEAK